MGKIINYNYLFILVLLVNFVGFYPSKGLSRGDSQDTSAGLASKYEELNSSIQNFSNNINKPEEVKKIRQQIQEIDKITKQLEKQKLKVSNIQKILRDTSSTYIQPAEDGLKADEIKNIQKQLGIEQTDLLDQDTKNKIQDRLLQNLEFVKKDINEIRIDLLEMEIKGLKAENNKTQMWVWGASGVGIALFLMALVLEFFNFLKNKKSNQSTGSPEENPAIQTKNNLEAELPVSGSQVQPENQEKTKKAEPSELGSQPEARNQEKETTEEEGAKISESDKGAEESSSEEENPAIQTKNNLEAELPVSGFQAESGSEDTKPEEDEGEKKYQEDTSIVLQPPKLSESNLVDIFNNDSSALSQSAIEVSETSESIDNRRLGYNKPVAVEKVSRNKGIAWVINIDGSYFLGPKPKLKINEYNYETIEALFDCRNYQQGQSEEFKLVKAAKLVSVGETWELSEKGELRFN